MFIISHSTVCCEDKIPNDPAYICFCSYYDRVQLTFSYLLDKNSPCFFDSCFQETSERCLLVLHCSNGKLIKMNTLVLLYLKNIFHGAIKTYNAHSACFATYKNTLIVLLEQ